MQRSVIEIAVCVVGNVTHPYEGEVTECQYRRTLSNGRWHEDSEVLVRREASRGRRPEFRVETTLVECRAQVFGVVEIVACASWRHTAVIQRKDNGDLY